MGVKFKVGDRLVRIKAKASIRDIPSNKKGYEFTVQSINYYEDLYPGHVYYICDEGYSHYQKNVERVAQVIQWE
jgi:hypothetical protein